MHSFFHVVRRRVTPLHTMNDHIQWDTTAHVYKVDLDEVDDRSISVIVVTSVATITNRTPNELDPLWESVAPDALDDIVDHTEKTDAECRVAFHYEGFTVEVFGNRGLRLAPSEERATIKA